MTLDQLADRILLVDETLRQQAAHAINCMLTARNWFIGFYIVEFEQHGADRAQYGEQLLKTLAKRINRKGMDWRSLYDFRTFYNVYPQLQGEIFRYLQSQMQMPTDIPVKKLQPLAAIFQTAGTQALTILQPAVAKSPEPWQTAPDRLFHRISYTSLQMLSKIDDPLKRAFYEFELIQGCWTKRELDRQISTLYYERSVLSKDKAALKRYIQQKAEPMETRHILRDPMTLEFLDLPEADVYTESKLETAILDKIEKFLMELVKVSVLSIARSAYSSIMTILRQTSSSTTASSIVTSSSTSRSTDTVMSMVRSSTPTRTTIVTKSCSPEITHQLDFSSAPTTAKPSSSTPPKDLKTSM